MYKTHSDKTIPTNLNAVFTFGSNLAGRHGAGAALIAKNKFGAICGVGQGQTGQSYAIPTKDMHLKSLPLCTIQTHVERFIEFAKYHQETEFFVTRIGCGLAGYKDSQIAPFFYGISVNCDIPDAWLEFIE